MYFRHIETSKRALAEYIRTQKANARARRKVMEPGKKKEQDDA